MPKVRDYFPGNNTTKGFFSYYRYILNQEEADKIICIKGGPGTGKSTFIRSIGNAIVDNGENVDFLHCSADENSLDGVILKDRKIAFIDGTSPHVTDPITPGAVDYILDFGQFWNEDGIAANKEKILKYSQESSSWYIISYNYLASAKKIYDSLNYIVSQAVEESDIYKVARAIIRKEMGEYEFSLKYGIVKKFFASAITPTGTVEYLKSLVSKVEKVYFINTPEGYENCSFMNMIVNNAIGKGLDVETFYCPINPTSKIEHIIIPDLDLAIVSGNKWHDIEPWEIYTSEEDEHQIVMVDINDFTNHYFLEKNNGLITSLSKEYSSLIYSAVLALSRAKENHDVVERIYMDNMDFKAVDKLRDDYIKNLL